MEEIVSFISQNALLAGSFVALVVIYIVNELRLAKANTTLINVSQAISMINHDSAQAVDLRDANLYAAGHLAKSINCLDFNSSHALLKQAKIIILIDNQVQKAANLAKECQALGHKVYAVKGGLYSFVNEKIPMIRGSK